MVVEKYQYNIFYQTVLSTKSPPLLASRAIQMLQPSAPELCWTALEFVT